MDLDQAFPVEKVYKRLALLYINYKCKVSTNQLSMMVVIRVSPEQTALHYISVSSLAAIEFQL